jgi:hypothetical protein
MDQGRQYRMSMPPLILCRVHWKGETVFCINQLNETPLSKRIPGTRTEINTN